MFFNFNIFDNLLLFSVFNIIYNNFLSFFIYIYITYYIWNKKFYIYSIQNKILIKINLLKYKKIPFKINQLTILSLNKTFNLYFNLLKNLNLKFFIVILFLIILFYNYLLTNNIYTNIVQFSNILQHLIYKFCTIWSNHEGSLFLWFFFITLYTYFFQIYNQSFIFNNKYLFFFNNLSEKLLLLIIIKNSNVLLKYECFEFLNNDLNPILQDILLLIHPPILYSGLLLFNLIYILTYFYLFLNNKYIFINLNILNIINLIAWFLLTIGIFLGSWWAYHELGWGGWWFWDPVENISLIPWIFSIILCHYILYLKQIKIKLNNLLIINLIIIFIFAILGTCVIRMNLINSIHLFINNNSRNLFFNLLLFQFLIYYLIFLFEINKITFKNKINYLNIINFIFLISNFIIIFLTFLPIFFKKINIIKGSFYNKILLPFYLINIYIYFKWFLYNKFYIKNKFIWFYLKWTFIYFNLIYIFIYFNFIKFNIFYIGIINFIFLLLNILIFNLLTQQKKFKISFYFHFIYIILIFILLISQTLTIDISKLLLINKSIILNYYEIFLQNIDFIFYKNYNTNIFNLNIKSIIFKDYSFFLNPEKKYFKITDNHIIKNNIFNNLLFDLQIFPYSGNLLNGFFFKFNYTFFSFFLWFFFIIQYIYIYILIKKYIINTYLKIYLLKYNIKIYY